MKIIIKHNKKPNFRLLFPTALILNRFTARLIPLFIKHSNIKITGAQAAKFINALNSYRRHNKGWKMVEVCAFDGTYVEVVL